MDNEQNGLFHLVDLFTKRVGLVELSVCKYLRVVIGAHDDAFAQGVGVALVVAEGADDAGRGAHLRAHLPGARHVGAVVLFADGGGVYDFHGVFFLYVGKK